MNGIYKEIYVSKKEPVVIEIAQGSNALPIVFAVKDWNVPQSATAAFYVEKPSGSLIFDAATIDGNEITVDVTTQMTAETGANKCQVTVIQGTDIMRSFVFILKVFGSIIDDSAIESQDEFTALEEALSAVSDVVTHAEIASKGSPTQGVYINDSGMPTPMTYSLNKTVPSNAVFTEATATSRGYVPAPTSERPYYRYCTDGNGNPYWASNIVSDGYAEVKRYLSRTVSDQTDFSRFYLVPFYAASALGVSTSQPVAYFTALLKKICTIFTSVGAGVFIGRATPDVGGFYMIYIYNTAETTNDLPTSSSGFIMQYGKANDIIRWGTESGTLYYRKVLNPTVVSSETVGTDSQASTSGSWIQKGSKTFSAGTYMIKFTGQFATNSTGSRQVCMSTTDSTSSPSPFTSEQLIQAAPSGAGAIMTVIGYRTFTTETTMYFYMKQDSGSSINTWGRIAYIRMGNA